MNRVVFLLLQQMQACGIVALVAGPALANFNVKPNAWRFWLLVSGFHVIVSCMNRLTLLLRHPSLESAQLLAAGRQISCSRIDTFLNAVMIISMSAVCAFMWNPLAFGSALAVLLGIFTGGCFAAIHVIRVTASAELIEFRTWAGFVLKIDRQHVSAPRKNSYYQVVVPVDTPLCRLYISLAKPFKTTIT